MTRAFWLLIITPVLVAIGQILLKVLSQKININLGFDGKFLNHFLSLLKEPLLFLIVLIYGIASILYLRMLKDLNLSFVYPIFISITVLLILLGSHLFLKEPVNLFRIIGSFVIIGGIFIIWFAR